MNFWECDVCGRNVPLGAEECIGCGKILCDKHRGDGDDDPPLCGACAHKYYVEELGRVTLSDTFETAPQTAKGE